MFYKLLKILLLLILMILSKIIFIMAVNVHSSQIHVEIKGILAFLVVDIYLLKIIHSKKLMYFELFALFIMVISEFSGENIAIITTTVIFILINVYILIKTWKWNPVPKLL